jgi:hypothetical protein
MGDLEWRDLRTLGKMRFAMRTTVYRTATPDRLRLTEIVKRGYANVFKGPFASSRRHGRFRTTRRLGHHLDRLDRRQRND